MEVTANDIAEALGGIVEGNGEITVSGVSEIDKGKPNTLAFLANPKYEPYIYTTLASIVLVNTDFMPTKEVKATLVRVADAYVAMASLLQMYEQSKPKKIGIEQPSYISEGAVLGDDVYVGAFAYIGHNVKIGDRVKLYPNVYIGDNTVIGNDVQLFAGVKIYSHTQIGDRCIVHSGAVLGADGFGFAPQSDGSYEKIPQLGKVILEDDVEIGANTCIDRAMMGATIIKKGVKIDNLVQIAHNCEINEHTVFAAQSGVAGSTKIGRNCVFGGQVGIGGHLQIGNQVKVQAQTGIGGNVSDKEVLMGTPAINLKEYYKSYAIFKKLPNLMKSIQKLEKRP